jgi:Cu/Ag efflux pump CusA
VIFGILTSTVFTLLVIPVVYWLLYGGKERSKDKPAPVA